MPSTSATSASSMRRWDSCSRMDRVMGRGSLDGLRHVPAEHHGGGARPRPAHLPASAWNGFGKIILPHIGAGRTRCWCAGCRWATPTRRTVNSFHTPRAGGEFTDGSTSLPSAVARRCRLCLAGSISQRSRARRAARGVRRAPCVAARSACCAASADLRVRLGGVEGGLGVLLADVLGIAGQVVASFLGHIVVGLGLGHAQFLVCARAGRVWMPRVRPWRSSPCPWLRPCRCPARWPSGPCSCRWPPCSRPRSCPSGPCTLPW